MRKIICGTLGRVVSVGLVAVCVAAHNANAQEPAPVSGKAFVEQAYQISQQAREGVTKEADYTKVIGLCQQGLEAGLAGESVAYTRQLQAWAHNRRGQIRLDELRVEDAMADFETSLKLNPASFRAYRNRGFCRAGMGDYPAALEDFDRAIKLNPKDDKAFFNRAETHFALGKFIRAIEDYTQVLKLTPNDAETYDRRGTAYYKMGDYQHAKADFDQSIRLDPKNAAPLVDRGDMFGDMGILDRAARDYMAAVKADPTSHRAYLSAAWMMATSPDESYRDQVRAVQSAKKALELLGKGENPYRYRYLDALAAAQASAGDFDQAIFNQTQAIQQAPPEEQLVLSERLKLYKNGKPYRDTKKTALPTPDQRSAGSE